MSLLWPQPTLVITVCTYTKSPLNILNTLLQSGSKATQSSKDVNIQLFMSECVGAYQLWSLFAMQLITYCSYKIYDHTINRQSHTFSSYQGIIIVHAIVKIRLGFTSSNLDYCQYNYFPNWTQMCVITYVKKRWPLNHQHMLMSSTSDGLQEIEMKFMVLL